MAPTRAVICGYHGKGNGGDEALLVSLLQMLPPEIKPLVLSGNPQETSQRYKVESCPRASAFAVLRALKAAQFFIWGGGSLMQDVTSWKNPLYYGGLMALAQQRGLQTIAWAQGIGPLKRSINQNITRRVLAGCSAISVRDRASAELLREWGIPCLMAPDPVWALEGEPISGVWDLPAPRIAVTLRPHPQLTRQRLQILTQALQQFQNATQTFLLLIPLQISQDKPIAEAISAQLSGPHKIILQEDPRQLKRLFRGVEMTIGMRLHSLIMAAAEESRCFALSYDPKVSLLQEQVNMPGWELEELPEDPALISRTWLEQYANDTPLNQSQLQSLRDRACLHQELLNNLLSQVGSQP